MAISTNIHINKVADLSEDIKEQFSLGVVRISEDRVRISVWLPDEEHCQLCLYKDGKIFKKMPMAAMKAIGIKDIFTITLAGEKLTEQLSQMEYDFRVGGEHCMDPYARLVGEGKSLERNMGMPGDMLTEKSVVGLFLMILTGRGKNGNTWIFLI